MISASDLYDVLSQRVDSGVTMQHSIREFYNERLEEGYSVRQASEQVAIVMGAWRTTQEANIQALEGDAKDDLRKTVNNVIGDISRNVRKLTEDSYTIKCAKKKPEYVYEVQEIQAKTEDPEPEESEDDEIVPEDFESKPDVAEAVRKLVAEYGLEQVAGEIAVIIKESQDA